MPAFHEAEESPVEVLKILIKYLAFLYSIHNNQYLKANANYYVQGVQLQVDKVKVLKHFWAANMSKLITRLGCLII